MPLDREARKTLNYLAGHLAVGVAAAFAFALLLLVTDAFGLWTLILEQERGWLAGLLLLFGLVVTFGSLAMGVGIHGLGPWRDGEEGD
jgi:hypothetical protein